MDISSYHFFPLFFITTLTSSSIQWEFRVITFNQELIVSTGIKEVCPMVLQKCLPDPVSWESTEGPTKQD